MGVDAEMLVIIDDPENHLTEKQVLDVSVRMCKTIGFGFFFVHKNCDLDISGDGHHALSIIKPHEDEEYESQHLGKCCYFQDGDTIVAKPNQQFIRVHMWARYYGPGYERGDALKILATAEFLERNINGSRILYGGDSSGICAEPFDAGARAELRDYFFKYAHRPYRERKNPFYANPKPILECKTCETEAIHSGGGRGEEYYYCDGCGIKLAFNPETGDLWRRSNIDREFTKKTHIIHDEGGRWRFEAISCEVKQ